MSAIFETMKAYLDQEGLSYTQLEEKPVLRLQFRSGPMQWICYAQAREAETQFIFYSVSPQNVPEERRAAVAEYITRANYGLTIGNFEMDFGDGEVRFKTGVDVEGDRLTTAMVSTLVRANLRAMDRYLPGLVRVIAGEISPAEAVEHADAQS